MQITNDERVRLQFITQRTPRYSEREGVELALRGGCCWIQLRMKDSDDAEILSVGRQVRTLCDQYRAVFILDDRVDLVDRVGADGVHLGLKDMPIDEARRLLGKEKIIGGTANTAADIQLHYRRGADYIGCGPFRFTTTKKNLSPTLGLEGYRMIVEQIKATPAAELPLIAIGGITPDDVAPIQKTGMSGVALSGAVLRAEDPAREMRAFVRALSLNAHPDQAI